MLSLGLLSLAGSLAHAADLPDEEKAALTDDQMGYLSTSVDGSVLVGLELDSAVVRYFDVWESKSFVDVESPENELTIEGCTQPIGIFMGAQTSSSYLVYVVCGDSTDEEDDGQIYRFKLTDDSSDDGALSLTVGAVSAVESSKSLEFTAATISPDGATLYLAARTSSGSTTVYSLDATDDEADLEDYSYLTTTSWEISQLAYNEFSDRLVAADTDGNVYVVVESDSALNPAFECGAAPRALLPIDSSRVLMVAESKQVYAITFTGDLVTGCSGSWTLANQPSSITRVTVDGAGNAADALFVRTGQAVEVYDTDSVRISPSSPTLLATLPTTAEWTAGDKLAGSVLSRVFLSGSKGLYVLSSGPWLTLGALEEPVVVTDLSPTFSITVTPDEDTTRIWYDLEPPFDSSVSGTSELGALATGEAGTFDIDTSALSELEEGVNTLFIYAQDANDNIGWAAIRILKASAPEAVAGFQVKFGNQKLYLLVEPPEDDTVDTYELLVSPTTFTLPAEGDDLPEEWSTDARTFTVDLDGDSTVDASYPDTYGDDWPISLDYSIEEATDGDDDDTVAQSQWSEDADGNLVYPLYPLQNAVTYFVAIRARSSGGVSGWTAVLSGTPEETCGAACLADEAGGFCSVLPPSVANQGDRWRFPGLAVFVPLAWMTIRRRRIKTR